MVTPVPVDSPAEFFGKAKEGANNDTYRLQNAHRDIFKIKTVTKNSLEYTDGTHTFTTSLSDAMIDFRLVETESLDS